MSRAPQPDLKKYLDKKIKIKLNGHREVEGFLRGFDPFMNVVLDDTHEITKTGEKSNIDMVVIRGNSIDVIEAMERI